MAGEFTGKIVVITGGSRGIGLAMAIAFAREGAQLVLAASSEANLAAAKEALAKETRLEPLLYAADLRNLDACEGLFRFVRDRLGRCDILINNAGATRAGKFLDVPDEVWHDGFALKFFACVRLCRSFWPMLKEAQGHVVNIIGYTARNPHPELLIGGAVNSAMTNFSKGLAAIGKIDGVNVNAIHPGMVETDLTRKSFAGRAAASGITPEEVKAQVLAKDGTRRFCRPEEVADVALFLCSERTRYIQGTTVVIDGGATPGVY
jgi:3-oxoacyl-[acyl-carrier protein] reductase